MTTQGVTASPRFPLFDSLRAIAALSVFVVHMPFLLSLGPNSPPGQAYLLPRGASQ